MNHTFSISHSLLFFLVQCSHLTGSLWAPLRNLKSDLKFMVSILPFEAAVVTHQQQLWQGTRRVLPDRRYNLEIPSWRGGTWTSECPGCSRRGFLYWMVSLITPLLMEGSVFSSKCFDPCGCHFSERACQLNLAIGSKWENRNRECVFGVKVGQICANRHLFILHTKYPHFIVEDTGTGTGQMICSTSCN